MRRIAQNQRERDSAVRISEHRPINCTLSTDKQVICAIDNDVIFRQPRDREGPGHWSHEEVDRA